MTMRRERPTGFVSAEPPSRRPEARVAPPAGQRRSAGLGGFSAVIGRNRLRTRRVHCTPAISTCHAPADVSTRRRPPPAARAATLETSPGAAEWRFQNPSSPPCRPLGDEMRWTSDFEMVLSPPGRGHVMPAGGLFIDRSRAGFAWLHNSDRDVLPTGHSISVLSVSGRH